MLNCSRDKNEGAHLWGGGEVLFRDPESVLQKRGLEKSGEDNTR